MTITLQPKVRKSVHEPVDNINDYVLIINTGRVILEVVQFEWHSAPCYDRRGKFHAIYGLKVPVRYAWDAIDLYGVPDKAILDDGSTFWIMRAKHDETGKVAALEAGNSSPFTVLTRENKI